MRLSLASCCFKHSLRDSAVGLSVMDLETHAQTLLKIKLQTELLSRFVHNQKGEKNQLSTVTTDPWPLGTASSYPTKFELSRTGTYKSKQGF